MDNIYQRNTKNLWFPYQKEPNPKDKDLFKAYWRNEKERLINGFYLANGQVYVSGWLYWHTVYWTIEIDVKIGNSLKSFKGLGQPIFRDLDWEMSINKERAEKEQKFIELVGSRRFGKSVWDSSMAAYYYTLFDNSEGCISGGNSKDIDIVTKKIETGLTHLHPVFQKQRIKNNWGVEVRAGFKDKKTGNPSAMSSNSRILMRNFQDGVNTMACNGLSPKFHVIDEIGKIPNLINCIQDTMPCWMNADGMFSVVIFSGTGGDMEVGKEAGDMFFSPEGYGILEFEDKWEHRGKIGWFVPATKARNEYKYPKTMAEYLGIDHPDLKSIIISVSDEEKCMNEFIIPRRLSKQKTGNPGAILKEKAYFPIKPSECFLVLSSNPFDIESAEKQLFRIKHQGVKTGYPVELKEDEKGGIYHVSTDKMLINEYEVKDQDPDAPIAIYEFPMKDPPWGLYVAGIDPYKQDQAKYSDSYGAVYIFKRIHNILDETFQDMFVASYVARPGNKVTWYENTRKLLKFYNAVALCENEDVGFIDYMMLTKKEGHYLADQPLFLKDIHPNSTVTRTKGIHVTPKLRAHFNGKLEAYQREVIHTERDEEGTVVQEILGTHRILDPVLLEEIIKYNGTGNFDRVVAASLAITYARSLDPIHKVASTDPVLEEYFAKSKSRKNLFYDTNQRIEQRNRKSKLFY
jgi:hypothetical protein